MTATPGRPSGGPPYWSPGTQVWWRYRRPGWTPDEPEHVHPVTVVRDDADALVAWIAPGTPVALPVRPDGRKTRESPLEEMFTATRTQGFDTWFGNGNLRIAPTGRPWSVWVFWHDDGSLDGWYVNLEAPHTRDEHNVYSSDRVLDVEVEADRRHARKDEHELRAAVEQGRYTAAEAAAIEADAAAVEAIVEAWGSPFRDGWETFRPNPSWPLPGLPDDLRRTAPGTGRRA
ncbi:DUF402 domain-containing protein [Nocardioides mesophilus]|uniref:DUF402 domain-containing protein n=1 Tax=Nocardioides mesophilus TaxID=433659 RepID=A0A7G9RDQ4_9ACTN|nr:DUF402 domain-containing protein [Nocardioides mesophilus]QNN53729.1 DUF402 domain-containing protein [Nocardioides mesophilus]